MSLWVIFFSFTNSIARTANGFVGDGAGVDDDGVFKSSIAGMAAHDIAFIGVEAAAQCDNLGVFMHLLRHGGYVVFIMRRVKIIRLPSLR